MWYRDYTLVQQRRADVERELRAAALAAMIEPAGGNGSAVNRIRIASAAGVRRLGRAVLSLSDRIEARALDPAARSIDHEVAYR
jgi:hypothetical protein